MGENQTNQTIVFRNSMYPRRHLYAKYMVIPEFESVTGLVLPNNPELIGADYVTVLDLTGDLRFILKSHIVTPKHNKPDKPISSKKEIFYEWKVRSKTNFKKEYQVTFKYNLWFCECMAFQFRRECNHITRAKAQLSKELGIQ